MYRFFCLLGLIAVSSLLVIPSQAAFGALQSPVATGFWDAATWPFDGDGFGPDATIDFNSAFYGSMEDDTPGPDHPTTGHLVYDMGAPVFTAGIQITSRPIPNTTAPTDVDFFYFADDDPSNNVLVDDIEGDADIILLVHHDFSPTLSNSASEGTSWAPLSKRWIGMRINDGGFDQVNFPAIFRASWVYSLVDVVPEPGSAVLAMCGAGIMLVRRSRRKAR